MYVEKLLELNGHGGAIYSAALQENLLFTASGDKFVAKWNLQTGEQASFSIQCEQVPYKIELVNDNRQLLIGINSGALHIIDLISKAEIRHFINHRSAIFEIKENSFKQHVYTTDADGNLAVWDRQTWDLLLFLPLNVGKIRSIALAHAGGSIFLACQDGTIREFDTENFNEFRRFHAHEGGASALLLPEKNDIELISAGKDGHIRQWDLSDNNKCVLAIPAHHYGIYKLLYLANGKYFVSISRDKSIKLWDNQTKKVLQKLDRAAGGHSHAVNDVVKVTEMEFVTVGDDKRIIRWHLVG